MSKHTPRPWRVTESSREFPEGHIVAKVTLCRHVVTTTKIQREEVEANATLIAAAPELLDAAREALAFLEWATKHANARCVHVAEPLRTAIAKAEGREP